MKTRKKMELKNKFIYFKKMLRKKEDGGEVNQPLANPDREAQWKSQ